MEIRKLGPQNKKPVGKHFGRHCNDDPVDDLDVNVAIWCTFLNATLRAAVHHGQECEANLRHVRNNLWNRVGLSFHETGKLISDQTEITGMRTIDFKGATWMSTSLLCEKAYPFTNAETYVFSDSVLCVGKMRDDLDLEEQNLNGIRKTITSRI